MDTQSKKVINDRYVYNEDYEEDIGIQLELEKVDAPVVWGRTTTGFKVEDLKEEHFEEVIKMFKEHYIPYEVLSNNTRLTDDEASLKSYIDRLIFHLNGMTSIIAIDENCKYNDEYQEYYDQTYSKIKIVGVLITRIVQKIDYGRIFSRVQLVQGTAMRKCIGLRAHISKNVDIFAKFNCETFMRYYDLCILPEYRENGLEIFLLRCGFNVATAMNAPVVMGIFTNTTMQQLVEQFGIKVLYEIKYLSWTDKGGEIIFDNPGKENNSCALMAGLVPQLPVPPTKSKEASPSKKDRGKKKGK